MKFDRNLFRAGAAFEGDTAGHELKIVPVNPSAESYLISFAPPASSGSTLHWANLFIGSGWWAYSGESGSFVCCRKMPMATWTADSIISRNDYLRLSITAGESVSVDEKGVAEEIRKMKVEVPDWGYAYDALLKRVEEEGIGSREALSEMCAPIDDKFGSEIGINLPVKYCMTYEWAWSSFCIAHMLSHQDVINQMSNDGVQTASIGWVVGFDELKEAIAVEKDQENRDREKDILDSKNA